MPVDISFAIRMKSDTGESLTSRARMLNPFYRNDRAIAFRVSMEVFLHNRKIKT